VNAIPDGAFEECSFNDPPTAESCEHSSDERSKGTFDETTGQLGSQSFILPITIGVQITYGVGLKAQQHEALASQISSPGTGHSNAGATLPSKDATRNKLPVPLPLEVAVRRPRIPRVAALIAGLTRPRNRLITTVKECDISRVCEILNDPRKVVHLNNRSLCEAITWAAGRGEEQVVRLLIKMGTDVNDYDRVGNTALHLASKNGRKQVVQLLIENGADANARDEDERTALHLALNQGHKQIIRLLIRKGADVNAHGEDGETMLHSASHEGHEQVVQLLIENGADVNARDEDGRTALHLALNQGHEQIIRLLIRKGADVNACDENGRTALHLALNQGHEQIIRLLIGKGADVNLTSTLVMKMGRPRCTWLCVKGTSRLFGC
jgi:ankyrin repeat protein